MAEKINKNERKNKAEIITEMPGDESAEFWKVLGNEDGMSVDSTVMVLNQQVLFFCNFKFFIISHVMKYAPGKLCAMKKETAIVITKQPVPVAVQS